MNMIMAFKSKPVRCVSCDARLLVSTHYCSNCIMIKKKKLESHTGYFQCRACPHRMMRKLQHAENHYVEFHSPATHNQYAVEFNDLYMSIEDVIDTYYVYNQDMSLYQKKSNV